MISVEKIVNCPVPSCCYLVYDKTMSNRCVVIDPGSRSSENLYAKFAEVGVEPEYIILTHEHFDHCWGVNKLRTDYPHAKLVCSEECSIRIGGEKTNMSVFYDNTIGFEIEPADVIISEKNSQILWNGHTVYFFMTPGHSSASTTIMVGNYLFTGDAYIPSVKTVTKLPSGNRELAAKSEAIIKTMLEEKELKLCAGH